MDNIDMTTTVTPKSDQLNADDLISGSMVIKITQVKKKSGDQPIAVHFEGDNNKPYLPCKSMRRVMIKVWGKYSKDYVGKSMELFCDPKVTWAGAEIGGIRISRVSDIDSELVMTLTASKAKRKKYVVKPLKVEKPLVADPKLIKDGDEAAALGVDAYTSWVGTLNADQKAPIKQHHKKWVEVAKKVLVETDEINFDV